MINTKLQYIIHVVFLIFVNTSNSEQTKVYLSVEELKYIVPKIRLAENDIHNIKIDSEAWVETKENISDPCEPWQRTQTYISSTAWIDGNSIGKARVDFHKEILKWKSGESPYLERNYSVGFDGKHSWFIYNSDSYNGKVFLINKYKILSEKPHQLRSIWYQKIIGINASLNFHFYNEEVIFSELFKDASDPNFVLENAELKATHQNIRGVECINISSIGKRFRDSWWLDPNRGFALLKYENTRTDKDGKELLVNSIDVRKLDEVAQKIWWPTEIYFTSASLGEENPWKRIVYRAKKVVANDTDFNYNIFTLSVPEGYSLDKAEYKSIYSEQNVEKENK